MRHVKFPSIDSFKHAVQDVNRYDRPENGLTAEDKKVLFKGTVKCHGTNAGVSQAFKLIENQVDSYVKQTEPMYYMARERNATIESDNAGFAFFCETNKTPLLKMMVDLNEQYGLDLGKHFPAGYIISIYGEWCGQGIQKNMGINQLPKMFVIFGAKATNYEKLVSEKGDDVIPAVWLDHSGLRSEAHRIYNINDFPTFELEVDFNNPQASADKLTELTIAVENECPVAKHFGINNGLGEGIVWQGRWKYGNLRFKTKGEKHQAKTPRETKVLLPEDLKKMADIKTLAEHLVPDGRVLQAVQALKGVGNESDATMHDMGAVIKWVRSDVDKENLQDIADAGFELKDVVGEVCKLVKIKFMSLMETF